MRTLGILLIFSFALGSQEFSNHMTATMMNGRAWRMFNATDKTIYIHAMHDALARNVLMEASQAEKDRWAEHFTVGDYVREFDIVYSAAENVRIPLPLALDYCTIKLKGMLPKRDLELKLIELRKLVATLQEN